MDRTKTKLGAPADDATETEQGTALSGRTTKLAKREGGGSRAGLANGATVGQVGGGQVGDDEPFFAIGELADEFAITTRTIRFYEARGLLVPARFRSNRAYSRRDRARLKLILRGKNLGFSLEDIAEYLLLYDSDPGQVTQTKLLLDKIEAHISDLNSKRTDLERTLMELKEIRAQCLGHLKRKD